MLYSFVLNTLPNPTNWEINSMSQAVCAQKGPGSSTTNELMNFFVFL